MAETFCRAHVEDHAGRVLCCEKLAGHGKTHRFGDDHWMESDAFYPPNEAPATEPTGHDPVNHPQHYTSHPSGVECITITQHMNFCRGNAVKYIWRAGEKSDEVEDLRKARFYIDKESERLEAKRAAQ